MSAEWVMVLITAVYVIATCFICWANIKSANASKAQLAEMQRQFYAANRPIVTVEIIYEKRLWWGLRFSNRGTQTAFNTEIELCDSFIDSLPDERFRNAVSSNNGKIRTIGVGQHYDLFFARNDYRKVENKPAIVGKIRYRGNDSAVYVEDFCIEMQDYAVFYSIPSETEDLVSGIEKQTDVLKRIQFTLEAIAEGTGQTDFKEGDSSDA